MRRAALVLLATLAFGSRANAASDNCTAIVYRGGCDLAETGARSAEDYAFRGFSLLRLTGRYGLEGYNFSAEIVRPPEGGAWVRIRDPFDAGPGAQAAIGDAEMKAIFDIWRDFEHKIDMTAIAKLKAERAGWPPCTDGAELQADIAEDGKARHFLIDMCLLPADDMAHAFLMRVFKAVPECADEDPIPAPRCLRLGGDRLAAAEVAKAIDLLRHASGKSDVESVVADRATASIDGRTIAGPDKVATWLAADPRYRDWLEILRIEGRAGEVAVTGRFIGEGVARDRPWSAAPFTQVWRRDAKGRYRLVSYEIGHAIGIEQW